MGLLYTTWGSPNLVEVSDASRSFRFFQPKNRTHVEQLDMLIRLQPYFNNEPLRVFTGIFDSMDEISPIVHGINEKASLNNMIS